MRYFNDCESLYTTSVIQIKCLEKILRISHCSISFWLVLVALLCKMYFYYAFCSSFFCSFRIALSIILQSVQILICRNIYVHELILVDFAVKLELFWHRMNDKSFSKAKFVVSFCFSYAPCKVIGRQSVQSDGQFSC